jgi:hypothetical protein
MAHHLVPLDEARVADTVISAREWKASADAHERFKALVESKPRAKVRYDSFLASLR